MASPQGAVAARDAFATPDGLAPAVHIDRRWGWQRRYRPRAERARELLGECARDPGSARARQALARRLAWLRAALLRSPYYAERLAREGLSPRDLRGLADLPCFPLLDRETLRDRWRDLPAFDPDAREARHLVAVQSSGSTGQPLTVPRDAYDCLHMWTVLRFFCDRLDVELPGRPRVVLLCSLSGGIEYSVRLPLLGDGALHRISALRPGARRKLERARPDVLFSDPAGLHWLVAETPAWRPRIVLSSAQYLSPAQRASLHAALPAPLVNYYSSVETGPLAWECPEALGRFHVLAPDVYLESVDGELVATRLRRGVVPLLRYRTGDRGEVETAACACGHRGQSIHGFTGRRGCWFVTPRGERVDAWRLAWLFKHYPLRGFRLTQRGPRAFELELAEEGACDAADLLRRLRPALALLGWPDADIALLPSSAIAVDGDKPEPFRTAMEARRRPRRRATGVALRSAR